MNEDKRILMKTNQSRLDERALHGLLRASRARAAHHERGVLKERVERKAERREQVVDGAIVAFDSFAEFLTDYESIFELFDSSLDRVEDPR